MASISRKLKPGVSATRAPGAASSGNSSAWRVVWRPRCSRSETSLVRRASPGWMALSNELLPTPEGPASTESLPANRGSSSAMPSAEAWVATIG
ncbi:hypothetical protein D3C72_843430 [compost metagenome]